MDWRFNTIWFEQLEQVKIFQKDFKTNTIGTENKILKNSEYAIIWHLKEKQNSFDNLCENDKLSYLELNCANTKNFAGIEKFKNLKRLELNYCVKLENDFGISRLCNNLEFLFINISMKFRFTDELLQLKKLRVLCINSCGPIDSLDFLNNFPNLIDFRFVDTNIVDGNLKPIFEHPTIRTVGFLNKRHYNYKDEQIKIELGNKFRNEYKQLFIKSNILLLDMIMNEITAAIQYYVHWMAKVHLASFASLFTLSQGESERSRKWDIPNIRYHQMHVVLVVIGNLKNNN